MYSPAVYILCRYAGSYLRW